MNKDIEMCESVMKSNEKKQELDAMKKFEIKKIDSLIACYEEDQRRVRMAYETIMAENTAALKIASDRVTMRNRYNKVYPDTAAYDESYQLQDALHTRSTFNTTARNPYVIDS